MKRESIAFFDVDHTISRVSTSLAFIIECMKRGLIAWRYLAAAPFLYLLYRLSSVSVERMFHVGLPKLKGIARSEFDEIADVAFARWIEPRLYKGALEEIARLKSEGIRVILATSAPFEAVYPIARHCGLGASDVVATQFLYEGGVFQGKLVGFPVFSKFKGRIVRDFTERSGMDLHYCSFYSDSVHDLPLLEMVGRPVAANPDFRLRRVAKRRGWLIKDFV
jgi:HAD superfamily hydrolase (TIGR01490 family)